MANYGNLVTLTLGYNSITLAHYTPLPPSPLPPSLPAPTHASTTYTAFSKLLGVDGRGEVEAPGVASGGVLPVHETLRSLANPGAWGGRELGVGGDNAVL